MLDELWVLSPIDELMAFLDVNLVIDFRDSISTVMEQGFGRGTGAISIASIREIWRSHVETGEIVVGRVSVEVIK